MCHKLWVARDSLPDARMAADCRKYCSDVRRMLHRETVAGSWANSLAQLLTGRSDFTSFKAKETPFAPIIAKQLNMLILK